MAEITRMRVGELLRGLFAILQEHPDGLPAKEALEELSRRVPPTEFENSTYPKRPDVRRYEKIVRFSTIKPVKAGWLVKDKGQWYATDEGLLAYRTYQDPTVFVREASKLYRQWKNEQPVDLVEEPEDSPGASTVLEEAEETAWVEIEEHLAEMNPYDFQELVAGLLRGMGYHISWVSPPGPDRDIDIIAHTDPLGITGPKIKVQVKRRQDAVGADGLRAFMAVLAPTDVGLFVCTGGFTRDAEQEARVEQMRRITLIDLRRLFDLWVEHYARVPEEKRRLLPLRPVHYLAPDE
jgi:restriction system protein